MLIRVKNKADSKIFTFRTISKFITWDNKSYAIDNRLVFFEKEGKEDIIKFNRNYEFIVFRIYDCNYPAIVISYYNNQTDSNDELKLMSFKPHCLYSWAMLYNQYNTSSDPKSHLFYFIDGIEIDQKDFVKGVKNYKIKRFTKNNI